jgi:hypothetical protein
MFSVLRSPVFAVLLAVFGGVLIYNGHKHKVEFAALRDHGENAEAEISKLAWEEKRSNNDDRSYTAHIRFRTQDGQDISEEKSISSKLGRDLRNRTIEPVMTVRYLPESPRTFRDANDEEFSDGERGVGQFMLLAGAVLLALRFFIKR